MNLPYTEVARSILSHQPCVVLSGAGISAESGIPTFRDKGGLWEKYDPTVYASIEVFRRDPSKYWTIRGEFIRNYDQFQPNPAHLALAELEQKGVVSTIITQNIDGLHTKAGSVNVIELHGSLRKILCLSCAKTYLAPDIPAGMPPRCECGGILKPDTVLFGEQLPAKALETAYQAAMSCRSMLVVGTSAVVYPAAALPGVAKQHGAVIIEINLARAFGEAHVALLDKAATVLPELLTAVDAAMSNQS